MSEGALPVSRSVADARCHWRAYRKTEQGILVRSGMFDLVEHRMLRASEHVAALVATGLMEGLIAASENSGMARDRTAVRYAVSIARQGVDRL